MSFDGCVTSALYAASVFWTVRACRWYSGAASRTDEVTFVQSCRHLVTSLALEEWRALYRSRQRVHVVRASASGAPTIDMFSNAQTRVRDLEHA